jgi:16S rRNA (guanine527-N7)-methyltransferase
MSEIELLLHYFPGLDASKTEKMQQLQPIYNYWNDRINVISRKDIELLYERHVLHSLAIAKLLQFNPGASILDVGTGGGFPGIPLAIFFPETKFVLVDSIGKKIKVVQEVVRELNLDNVCAMQARAETVDTKYDFVVSRAVTTLPEIVKWIKGKIKPDSKHELENGLLYLKGGDFTGELQGLRTKIYEIQDFFNEPFFETKKLVHVYGL